MISEDKYTEEDGEELGEGESRKLSWREKKEQERESLYYGAEICI